MYPITEATIKEYCETKKPSDKSLKLIRIIAKLIKDAYYAGCNDGKNAATQSEV